MNSDHPFLVSFSSGDIDKRLNDIQSKLPSADELKRKQDDLIAQIVKQQMPVMEEIKRLSPMLDKFKESSGKQRSDVQRRSLHSR